jgi:hypothetical protein
MTGNDEGAPWWEITFDEMKIRATDATGHHTKTNLTSRRLWNLALNGNEGTRVHGTRGRNRPRTHNVTHDNLLNTPFTRFSTQKFREPFGPLVRL